MKKLDKFNTTILKNGHCLITFNQPLNEKYDMYDINLLIMFFGQKKHKEKILKIERETKPLIIKSILLRTRKDWAMFMKELNLNAYSWYKWAREQTMAIEDVENYLRLMQDAEKTVQMKYKDGILKLNEL